MHCATLSKIAAPTDKNSGNESKTWTTLCFPAGRFSSLFLSLDVFPICEGFPSLEVFPSWEAFPSWESFLSWEMFSSLEAFPKFTTLRVDGIIETFFAETLKPGKFSRRQSSGIRGNIHPWKVDAKTCKVINPSQLHKFANWCLSVLSKFPFVGDI